MNHDKIALRFGARLAVVGLAAAIGLLAAACDGTPGPAGAGTTTTIRPGSPSTTVAPSGSSTTTVAPSGPSGGGSSADTNQREDLQLAQCMRSNGIPKFPDTPANGTFLSALGASGVDPHSPTFQAALQACRRYDPDENMTPAQSAAQNAAGLAISQCMRSHGVTNFPDPTTGPLGEQVINLHGLGIDMNSPTFQAASTACGGK